MSITEIDHAVMMREFERDHAFELALDLEIDSQIDKLHNSPCDYSEVTEEFYGIDTDYPIEAFFLALKKALKAKVSGAEHFYLKANEIVTLCTRFVDTLESKEQAIATKRATKALKNTRSTP